MITFKQFITEARMAPLYHATSLGSASLILKSNEILTGAERPGYHGKQISLTRDLDFAVNWSSVVFELDQQKLTQNYKIKPYSFFGRDYNSARRKNEIGKSFVFTNQSEEAITKTIKPLDRYLTRIILNLYDIEKAKENPRNKIIFEQKNLYSYDHDTRKLTKI